MTKEKAEETTKPKMVEEKHEHTWEPNVVRAVIFMAKEFDPNSERGGEIDKTQPFAIVEYFCPYCDDHPTQLRISRLEGDLD